jgi:hypothetical protein
VLAYTPTACPVSAAASAASTAVAHSATVASRPAPVRQGLLQDRRFAASTLQQRQRRVPSPDPGPRHRSAALLQRITSSCRPCPPPVRSSSASALGCSGRGVATIAASRSSSTGFNPLKLIHQIGISHRTCYTQRCNSPTNSAARAYCSASLLPQSSYCVASHLAASTSRSSRSLSAVPGCSCAPQQLHRRSSVNAY